jgi:predicted phage tail protein
MKLIFHGKLRDLYGESFVMAGDVPAEVIEGFFSQQPDHPRNLVIDAVGFNTEEKLREATDQHELHLVPAMYGGGGNFGKILIGAVLIAIAIWNPGLAAIGIAMELSAAGTAMFVSMGVALALQGVMGIFFKAPSTSKDADPPPSRYLGINTNTTAQGTPITIACGRNQIAGHWLSLQSDADKLALGKFPVSFT